MVVLDASSVASSSVASSVPSSAASSASSSASSVLAVPLAVGSGVGDGAGSAAGEGVGDPPEDPVGSLEGDSVGVPFNAVGSIEGEAVGSPPLSSSSPLSAVGAGVGGEVSSSTTCARRRGSDGAWCGLAWAAARTNGGVWAVVVAARMSVVSGSHLETIIRRSGEGERTVLPPPLRARPPKLKTSQSEQRERESAREERSDSSGAKFEKRARSFGLREVCPVLV